MNNTAIRAEKERTIFKNESHRRFYEEWLSKCRYQDVFRLNVYSKDGTQAVL